MNVNATKNKVKTDEQKQFEAIKVAVDKLVESNLDQIKRKQSLISRLEDEVAQHIEDVERLKGY